MEIFHNFVIDELWDLYNGHQLSLKDCVCFCTGFCLPYFILVTAV